tara:strand:+ start:683 stop:856 length:174 start_codon:yes stop_codon:yes gene_type:complete
MIDYTIMEYNIQTRRYVTIGFAEGIGPKEAKANYIEKNQWHPRNEDVILFAKGPVCR